MRVRMKVQVSGMRNGQPWPERGTVIDLPDDEAQHYIGADMAVPVGALDAVETATAPDDTEKRGGALTTQTGPATKSRRR